MSRALTRAAFKTVVLWCCLGLGPALVVAFTPVDIVIRHAPPPVARPGSPAATSGTFQPDEDSAAWNCITMGNHRCGPGWDGVPPTVDAAMRDEGHRHCIWLVGPTTRIVCPDGYVTTS